MRWESGGGRRNVLFFEEEERFCVWSSGWRFGGEDTDLEIFSPER